MSQTIEVESIRRMVVNPGETLVVTLEKPTQEQAEYIRHRMRDYLPDGVGILVVSSDITLNVVASSTLPATDG